ncbi:MAG TPA: type IV toxin-antitoxin system AbiEi family antitoxin [Hyphomicrobiales bacterium]|nr:type IV toxin-antitoxin system AbiEi family antitoxin [Hyphomicrobiales bacterium]
MLYSKCGSKMLSSEAEIVRSLVGTLNEVPDSHAHIAMEGHPGEPLYDAQVEGMISGKPVTLLVEVKQHVYPRDVHQYLYQRREIAKRFQVHLDSSVLILLAAHSISPGAREILREEKSAYYDAGGSLFISSNGLLVDRQRPAAPSEERVLRSLFTGTRARVLLSMLDRPKEWINVTQLSRDAGVSTATASEVLQAMERNDWVMTEGSGPHKQRRLIRPDDVLDAWAKFVETRKAPKQHRYYVPHSSLDLTYKVPQVLEQRQVEYEVTGEAAAQHYAPWLTQVPTLRVRIVYSDRVDDVLGELGAKSTSEGANLSIYEVASTKDLLHRNREDGVWYAHPIQVYLDLLRMEGRARDAARRLREERIKF